MRIHVEEAMTAGAAGISTGLEYQPGQSASQAELTMVAEMAGAHEGLYATHSRNRTSRIEQSAVEAIDIAHQSGCRLQLSHFLPRPYVEKAAFERALERMDRARDGGMMAFSDVHPHLIGPGPLAQMLPAWAWRAGPAEIPELMRDGAWRRRVLEDLDPRMREYLNSGVADGMLIVHAPGSEHVVGCSLGALARETGTTPDEAAMDLMRDAGEDFYAVTELETWTTREDMDRFLAHEHYMLMGDGVTLASHGKLARFHFCAADWNWVPELIYEQALKRRVVPIESMIRRMTSMPARQLGLHEVGELRPGWRADIAVFEPELTPHAGPADDPMRPVRARGSCIRMLLVNGVETVVDGAPTRNRAGRVGRA
jgi:N-acyl-D-amino-acid deacylase